VAFPQRNELDDVSIQGAFATIAKRGGQFGASADTLRPAGFAKENFAGKVAHRMDTARVDGQISRTLAPLIAAGAVGVLT
jgi:hypothetical protein